MLQTLMLPSCNSTLFYTVIVEPTNGPSIPEQTLPTVPDDQFTCTGRVNGLYADPEDCNMYYACSNNGQSKFHVACDPSLIFNPYCICCDWPQNYDCNGVSDFSCVGKSDGLYPDVDDNECKAYFTCSNGQITGRTLCTEGTIFNPVIRDCDWPSAYQCPPSRTTRTSTSNY